MHEQNNDGQKKLSFITVILSACASAFGVQTKENRERDFKHGKASAFILAGLIFVTLFVGAVYGVVQLVLSTAAGN